jgi:hypothetical protein
MKRKDTFSDGPLVSGKRPKIAIQETSSFLQTLPPELWDAIIVFLEVEEKGPCCKSSNAGGLHDCVPVTLRNAACAWKCLRNLSNTCRTFRFYPTFSEAFAKKEAVLFGTCSYCPRKLVLSAKTELGSIVCRWFLPRAYKVGLEGAECRGCRTPVCLPCYSKGFFGITNGESFCEDCLSRERACFRREIGNLNLSEDRELSEIRLILYDKR